jgi:undecaprenyl-diphosphatase
LALASVLVSDQRLVRGEVAIFEAVNGWPRWIGAPLEVVMHLGDLAAAIALVALLAVASLPSHPRPVVALTIAAIAGWRFDNVLKEVIERPRPPAVLPDAIVRDETASGFGFPSGHTTLAFALAAVLTTVLPRRLRWLPWVLAAAVGVARMYVGVHWPMDVVGGAALGIAIGSAALVLVGHRTDPAPHQESSRGAN